MRSCAKKDSETLIYVVMTLCCKTGFTNIPLGFSSPFVMRRQQLSQTTHLVAAAMAKNKGVSESQKQSEGKTKHSGTFSTPTDN